MSRPNSALGSVHRPGTPAGHPAGWMAALALLGAPQAALAAAALPPIPPPSQFRSLQLITLACGRDNDVASCDKARAMADPLLDHPRLSASCKDTLWAIREKARSAPANSAERREGIDRAAKDVTVFCRQPAAPASSGSSGGNRPPGAGSGGAGFFSAPTSR